MPTTRLGLPTPAGTALISTGDNDISALATILDRAALWLVPGTFAARPAAAGNDGRFYRATDVGILYLSDGTTWHEVSRGGGEPPIGSLVDYAGAGDPEDTRWLLADGRAISRTTYAAAFAVMGITHGAGDGSTTFNIPDARGRTIVGPDNMGTAMGGAGRMASNNTRGASGGTETKTILEANLPPHTHGVGTIVTVSAGSHDHSAGTLATASDGAHTHGIGTLSVNGSGALVTGNDSPDHVHSGFTDNQSAAHQHDTADVDQASIQAVHGGDSFYTFLIPSGQGGVPYLYSTTSENANHGHGYTTGGASARHTHTTPSHTHGLSGATASAGAHTHALSGATTTGGAHAHTMSGATASVGSGTALNGMPPYLVANKIVRVA